MYVHPSLAVTLPDLPADRLLETEEWQAAYVLNKPSLPQSPPRLNEALQQWREWYNHGWLLECHGFRSPSQARADYLETMPVAA